jgi:protein involved in polysaccharide export with SLBB domain
MADPFERNAPSLDSPATRHFAITAANTDMAIIPRALYCTAAGTAVVRDAAGTDVTYTLEVGDVLTFRAVQVRTGSTATVIGWY